MQILLNILRYMIDIRLNYTENSDVQRQIVFNVGESSRVVGAMVKWSLCDCDGKCKSNDMKNMLLLIMAIYLSMQM